jgi:hypothetical protein
LAAFTLLGTNSNAVTRPANLKELSVAFLNSATANGKIAPGLAVEWAPFHTLGSNSLAEYRQTTFLRRIQLSFATAQDSAGSNIAFGIRCVPLDYSDPLNDEELNREVNNSLAYFDLSTLSAEKRKKYLDQVSDLFVGVERDPVKIYNLINIFDPVRLDTINITVDSLVKEIIAQRKTQSDVQLTSVELQRIKTMAGIGLSFRRGTDVAEDVNRLIENAQRSFTKRKWNAAVIQLSAGTILNSSTSSWSTLRSSRFSAFAGGSFPFCSFGQFITQLQYTAWYGNDSNEKTSYSIGARLVAGTSGLHGTLEALFASTKRTVPRPDDRTLRYTLGLELKMAEGIWLELAMGAVVPQDGGLHSGMMSLANVKYAFGKQAKFSLP